MKKILVILVIVIAGCTPKYMLISSGIDFSKYATRGFTMSTTTINQHYEPIGLVEAYCAEGVIAHKVYEKDSSDPIYDTKVERSDYITCTTHDILEALYKEAIIMKANGIINLKLSSKKINGREIQIAMGEAVKIK